MEQMRWPLKSRRRNLKCKCYSMTAVAIVNMIAMREGRRRLAWGNEEGRGMPLRPCFTRAYGSREGKYIPGFFGVTNREGWHI